MGDYPGPRTQPIVYLLKQSQIESWCFIGLRLYVNEVERSLDAIQGTARIFANEEKLLSAPNLREVLPCLLRPLGITVDPQNPLGAVDPVGPDARTGKPGEGVAP